MKAENISNDFFTYSGHVQVSTAHYDLAKYLDLGRWNSYWHQIEETLAFKPESVLIVGKGDNIVGTVLAQQGIKVTTFDFDKSLQPDITGNVMDIQKLIGGAQFDILLCCQVLEHLPYEHFENILQQFTTVADKVIVSLPYSSAIFKVDFKISHIRERRMMLRIHNAHKVLKPNEEHYWEIGFKGYPKRRIIKSIEHFFVIEKQFTAKHNHYHLFFILRGK